MGRQLADHFSDLTGHRDRDQLDANLDLELRDLVGPRRVAVLRWVGDPGDLRWATRARIDVDGTAAFERLRLAVESVAFPQVGHVTVSVGFTTARAGDNPSGVELF
jgi:hypothetical protein